MDKLGMTIFSYGIKKHLVENYYLQMVHSQNSSQGDLES